MLPTAAPPTAEPPPLELVSPGEGAATRAPKPRPAAAPGVHGRRYQRGVALGQVALLPACVDDYVSADHLVRAIDAFVDSLDLGALGFIYSTGALTAGQPAYDPADLLKLFLYGYLNQLRSSRRLDQECGRNLELMWLLKGLRPSYRSIATFRSANAEALKAANRAFVRLCRELQLVGGECFGLDGSFFNANASAASVKSKEQIEAQLAACERDLERYLNELEHNDAAAGDTPATPSITPEQLTALQARAAQCTEWLATLEENGADVLGTTDPDARHLTKRGQTLTGYNVQAVVDDAYKLIVEHEVTNAGNDLGQLLPMAEQTLTHLDLKAAGAHDDTAAAPDTTPASDTAAAPPPAEPATAAVAPVAAPPAAAPAPRFLADAGYYTESDIAACQAQGLRVDVPIPKKQGSAERDGRYPGTAFRYDEVANCYYCPAEHTLKPQGQPSPKNGVLRQRYVSDPQHCQQCPQRAACLPEKTKYRQIFRSEHAAAIERHRAHMQANPGSMRERAGLCEHPFGTLKRWLGWDHFLVRGFEKVRGEMALLVNCYNLRRVLSILGVAPFIAICQARQRAREQAQAVLAALLRLMAALRTRRRARMAPARHRHAIFIACPGAA